MTIRTILVDDETLAIQGLRLRLEPHDDVEIIDTCTNGREAIRESLLDEAEGADILLIKPGLPYLDVLARLRERTLLPLAAYQVSGEYAMIKFAAAAGAVDERRAVRETLGAFKRAGADLILSYFAADVIREGW